MNNNQKELWLKAKDETVHFLTPEDLAAFAAAEQTEADANKAMAGLLEIAKARNVSSYQEPMTAEEKEFLSHFDPAERDGIRQMYPDELARYADLGLAKGKAILLQGELVKKSALRGYGRE